MQPLQERVLVEPISEVQTGLIIVPDSVNVRATRGRVVSFGPAVTFDIKVGDVVTFTKHCGLEVRDGDKRLLMLHQEDLGVVLD